MPLYEYACAACGDHFELLVRTSERPGCPQCGSKRLEKQLSVPAAHTAKGTSLPICEPQPRSGGLRRALVWHGRLRNVTRRRNLDAKPSLTRIAGVTHPRSAFRPVTITAPSATPATHTPASSNAPRRLIGTGGMMNGGAAAGPVVTQRVDALTRRLQSHHVRKDGECQVELGGRNDRLEQWRASPTVAFQLDIFKVQRLDGRGPKPSTRPSWTASCEG